MAIQKVEPRPEKDELVPTQRLVLQGRWRREGLVILEDVENLCATDVRWAGPAELRLRLPLPRASGLRVQDGRDWGGVKIRVELHADQVKLQRESRDGQRRLIVIEECESGSWNLYLRRAGEPNYNEAMNLGWDDPDLLGGFEARQPPLSLEWTGPRSALIRVPGKPYGVTVREKAGDVIVKWKFERKFNLPEPAYQTLEPIKN